MRFPVLAKLSALGVVLIVLLWALEHVSAIVAERTGRWQEAQRSVAESLASAQTIAGPVLQRVCTERWEVDKGEGAARRKVSEQRTTTLRSLPATLRIDAETAIDPRYRGIFRVNGYTLKANLAAGWTSAPTLTARREHEGSRIECGPAELWVGVSDARGIRGAKVGLQGRDVPVLPGGTMPGAGQTFRAEWPGELPHGQPLAVTIDLELAGTQGLAFAPIADATEVMLQSDWPHPSFGGRFLPVERQVTSNGFTATWKISALATQAPAQLLGSGTLCQPGEASSQRAPCIDSFGVGFFDPVSPYTLSDRATKYGLLFIALTFVAVGVTEVTRRARVHPVQYLLVGTALVTFFLLLVSLSEHLTFGRAYLAASAACTALLAFYGASVLGALKRGLVFGAGIGVLFGVLYVLLLQEQKSLVIGSILIFAVVAAVMVITRNIDWYGAVGQLRRTGMRPDGAE
jgi:inner membrane protein